MRKTLTTASLNDPRTFQELLAHQRPELIDPSVERRQVQASKLDRIVAGVLATANDIDADFPEGVDVRPILAERLRRIAGELERLSSRDLLRVAPLHIEAAS